MKNIFYILILITLLSFASNRTNDSSKSADVISITNLEATQLSVSLQACGQNYLKSSSSQIAIKSNYKSTTPTEKILSAVHLAETNILV